MSGQLTARSRRPLRLTMSAAALLAAALLTANGGPARAATMHPAAAARARPVISTLAGGVGGPAAGTRVSLGGSLCGVTAAGRRVYLAAESAVRQVSQKSGYLTTPAGSGAGSPLGNGGAASRAGLSACGAAADHSGNLVIADTFHNRIRVVAARTGSAYGKAMTAGHIYNLAGTGAPGYAGDGGPASAAELSGPGAILADSAGNLVIADTQNSVIRVVAARTGRFYGQAMTAGHIYTVAGSGASGYSGDRGRATAADLSFPGGVAADHTGNLVIADTFNDAIRVVAVRTGTFYGQAMTAGDIYTVAGTGTPGYSGDGGKATSAELRQPGGVAVDGPGNLVIADTLNNRIRLVAVKSGTFYGRAMTAGHIYTVAGTGEEGYTGNRGRATAADLGQPDDVATDRAGNLVIADTFNDRARVVAAHTGTYYGRKMTARHIYTVAGNGQAGFSGDTGPAARAQLDLPEQVAVTSTGAVAAADLLNNRVRLVAARTGTYYGRKMTAGHLYTVAGNGRAGFSGDGGLATRAELFDPHGIAADSRGNLLIGATASNRIRVVAARTGTFYGQVMTAGHIYTLAGDGTAGDGGDGGPATAAELASPYGMAADSRGNVLIADNGNNAIRVVAARTGTFYGQAMTAGDIYTVAGNGSQGYSGDGGPARSAALSNPGSVTVDHAGNVVISDSSNSVIRVVAEQAGRYYGQAMTAGDIYTVAGDDIQGYSGDGSPAAEAELSGPGQVAVDGSGNLVIADTFNGRIRVVAARSGTYYGRSMTAGDIYTVAGNGRDGFAGDGGPATSAELDNAAGVTVTGAGALVIADSTNGRIRKVSS